MTLLQKSKTPHAYHYAALAVITLIALLLRAYKIGELPTGIYIDEAHKTAEAIYALATDKREWFYTFHKFGNPGVEGGIINAILYSFKFFGIGLWQLKLPSILFGTLTPLAVWFLARELFPARPRLALAAAWFAAVSYWSLNFSRIAFRGIMVAPILACAVALFLRGVRQRSQLSCALGGLIFGLGFHTYIAYRISPALLLALIFLLWLAHGTDFMRQARRSIGLC